MSLVLLSHMCSHLQNAVMAKHTLAAVPLTKLHLNVAVNLLREGFISSVQRGSSEGPDEEYTPTTPSNVPDRKLWIGLKYHNGRPVMSKLQMLTKPTRRCFVTVSDLKKLINGRNCRYLAPLDPGESLFLHTADFGLIEARTAISYNTGGEALLRVR
ncbi:hypothetical protein CANCADRAFT_141992 [Tortispora caseinolytica NRRL Y-17796]|uniref:Ribosomal protein S8 n=1 Tax=Tortispora caseinolytica NRRL Y-17796 TaxID=767744 RepID=A0A1E4TD16_9ASCO|nr:hypothetical protein CANCADRAFT_141992 [Tortispora caseinolytica NRRL Y-17796]